MKVVFLLILIPLVSVIVTGVVRWRDQSFLCVLGRILFGEIIGMLVRSVLMK